MRHFALCVFVMLSICCHAATGLYSNACAVIVNFVAEDARTNATAKADLPNAVSATRTPLRAYAIDHYSAPPVSNLVLRLVSVYSDDPENKTFYEEVLSGEIKRQFDEMRATGALEF